MVMPFLAALALAAQAPTPPTGEADAWLIVDCRLGRIDFQAMQPVAERHRFAILMRLPEGMRGPVDAATLRLFDPDRLLGGLPLAGASFRDDRSMMFARTDESRPAYYRFAASPAPGGGGAWRGGLGLNGQGSRQEHEARSYMGECTMSQPGDAVAQFEAMGTAQ